MPQLCACSLLDTQARSKIKLQTCWQVCLTIMAPAATMMTSWASALRSADHACPPWPPSKHDCCALAGDFEVGKLHHRCRPRPLFGCQCGPAMRTCTPACLQRRADCCSTGGRSLTRIKRLVFIRHGEKLVRAPWLPSFLDNGSVLRPSWQAR